MHSFLFEQYYTRPSDSSHSARINSYTNIQLGIFSIYTAVIHAHGKVEYNKIKKQNTKNEKKFRTVMRVYLEEMSRQIQNQGIPSGLCWILTRIHRFQVQLATTTAGRMSMHVANGPQHGQKQPQVVCLLVSSHHQQWEEESPLADIR